MAYTPENNPYIPGDPYSYNLNWIVAELKKAIDLYQPLNDKFDNLYDYVHDYFDNLDLTAEVQAIIDQMIADGFFDTLVANIVTGSGTIESTVTEWLTANVTPVGSAVVVDASLSIEGAAADAKVTGNIMKSAGHATGINLLESAVITTGGYIQGNVITADADLAYTDYIQVAPDTDYHGTLIRFMNYYDADKNYISGDGAGIRLINSSPDDLYHTPTTCYFVRVTIPADVSLKAAFGPSEQGILLPEALSIANKWMHDIVNPNIAFRNQWLPGFRYATDGTYDPSYASYKTSNMIPVTAGTTIHTGYPRTICYFDSSKTFVSGVNIPAASTGPDMSYTIPSGVSYMTISYDHTQYNTPVVSLDSLEPFKEQFFSKIKSVRNRFSGKEIAVFGDSIMEGGANGGVGPGEIMSTLLGMTLDKYALGGAVMGYLDALHSQIQDQVATAISDSITPDLILINGGTNDMNGAPNCPLGTMTNDYIQPVDTSTFSGGMENALRLLKTNFPNALVVYIRAHNMASRLYDRQIDYGERAIDISHKWAVEICDIYNVLNTNMSYFKSAYLADTTHPNQAGYDEFYIPQIINTIFNYFNK